MIFLRTELVQTVVEKYLKKGYLPAESETDAIDLLISMTTKRRDDVYSEEKFKGDFILGIFASLIASCAVTFIERLKDAELLPGVFLHYGFVAVILVVVISFFVLEEGHLEWVLKSEYDQFIEGLYQYKMTLYFLPQISESKRKQYVEKYRADLRKGQPDENQSKA